MNECERHCPQCKKILAYKSKYCRNRAERKNLLCISCVQKTYIHSLKYQLTERICPECGATVKHKNRACMLRSWKKNKICKYCMRKRLGSANYNPKACVYFDKLSKEKGWNLLHALNGGEKQIITEKFSYWLDAYDPDRNIVVEYDEPIHYNRQTGALRKKDWLRQLDIINHLCCQFYRYNEQTGQLNVFTLPKS